MSRVLDKMMVEASKLPIPAPIVEKVQELLWETYSDGLADGYSASEADGSYES